MIFFLKEKYLKSLSYPVFLVNANKKGADQSAVPRSQISTISVLVQENIMEYTFDIQSFKVLASLCS